MRRRGNQKLSRVQHSRVSLYSLYTAWESGVFLSFSLLLFRLYCHYLVRIAPGRTSLKLLITTVSGDDYKPYRLNDLIWVSHDFMLPRLTPIVITRRGTSWVEPRRDSSPFFLSDCLFMSLGPGPERLIQDWVFFMVLHWRKPVRARPHATQRASQSLSWAREPIDIASIGYAHRPKQEALRTADCSGRMNGEADEVASMARTVTGRWLLGVSIRQRRSGGTRGVWRYHTVAWEPVSIDSHLRGCTAAQSLEKAFLCLSDGAVSCLGQVHASHPGRAG